MTIHKIVKQIAEQLNGISPINNEEGYKSLYPFDTSIDINNGTQNDGTHL